MNLSYRVAEKKDWSELSWRGSVKSLKCRTLSVGELIEKLKLFESNAPVFLADGWVIDVVSYMGYGDSDRTGKENGVTFIGGVKEF